MAEQDKVHFELKDILNLEKKNERKSFVEEEAMYLDAKIRFLWVSIGRYAFIEFTESRQQYNLF